MEKLVDRDMMTEICWRGFSLARCVERRVSLHAESN